MWNLLLGIAGVVAVGAAGHRLFGARAGWYAALILMSAPLYLLVGQVNLLDMGVTFFLSAALLCFVLAQQDQASTAQRWRWMLLCWSALGLGFLQKGLEALAVPGVALVAYTVLRRDATLWGRLHLGAGLAVLAVWVLPWNVLLALRDGRYAEFFLIHEHFTRFLTTEHQRVQPFWYFGAVLVGACLPWTGLMLQSAWSALRSRTRVGAPGSLHFDVPLALAVWAATVVVFFSLSGSKLVPYIMPCVPPLALLAGRALALREDSRSAAPGLVGRAAGGFGAGQERGDAAGLSGNGALRHGSRPHRAVRRGVSGNVAANQRTDRPRAAGLVAGPAYGLSGAGHRG